MSMLGESDLKDKLLNGHTVGKMKYKVHLDGFDQTDLITGTRRKEFFYFTETAFHGLRYGDWKVLFKTQDRWFNGIQNNLTIPLVTNVKLDPFERFHMSHGFDEWQENRAWVFGPAKILAAEFFQTFKDYPPRQASFGIDVDEMMRLAMVPIQG